MGELAEVKAGNFRLTTVFSDGDVVEEFLFTQRAVNRAKRWWVACQKLDAENGNLYGIVSFRVVAL
jgi:hypothetical protein